MCSINLLFTFLEKSFRRNQKDIKKEKLFNLYKSRSKIITKQSLDYKNDTFHSWFKVLEQK